MKNDNNNLIFGLISIVAGVLVIVFPNMVSYVIGLFLIVYGVMKFF